MLNIWGMADLYSRTSLSKIKFLSATGRVVGTWQVHVQRGKFLKTHTAKHSVQLNFKVWEREGWGLIESQTINRLTSFLLNNASETDVAPWCYKWTDGLDGSPGGVKYSAPYGANNNYVETHLQTFRCKIVGVWVE